MQSIHSAVFPVSLASTPDVGLNYSHPKAVLQWREYALSRFPEEAVGFFLTDDQFVPVVNSSPTPKTHFEFSPKDYLAYEQVVEGVVHSHCADVPEANKVTYASAEPSALDMQKQIESAVPWGISTVSTGGVSPIMWWGDSLPIRPFIGRVFVHGINDCFSLLRDWHRLQGVHFDDVPREPDWWPTDEHPGTGEDLYMDGFASRGFERVTNRAPKAGDVFICSMNSTKRNHAGVFVRDDTLLHHFGGSLSRHSPAHTWRRELDFIVRHKDMREGDYAPID